MYRVEIWLEGMGWIGVIRQTSNEALARGFFNVYVEDGRFLVRIVYTSDELA